MSYPPARYEGADGEVNATYRSAGHQPDLAYPSGNRVHGWI